MSHLRQLWTPRTLSLIAVCAQSVALAIVLHVSQSGLKAGEAHFKPSSAVLITELGKLVLSSLLVLLDVRRERANLRKPVHALPSPELYASAEDVHKKDLYSDPFDSPQPPSQANGNGHAPKGHLRRRSSQQVVAQDLRLDVQFEDDDGRPSAPLPQRSLSNYSWSTQQRPPTPEKKRSESPLANQQEQAALLRRRRKNLLALMAEDVFGGDWWRMAIPAVLFAVQNNLIYFAARNLSVPVFQITFQIKTLMIALAAVIMLKRRLAVTQWIALVLLAAGVATMQLSAVSAKAKDSHEHKLVDDSGEKNYVVGLLSVLVSCACASISSTYFELVIKRKSPETEHYSLVDEARPAPKPASLWVRNVQLSLFSTFIGCGVVLVQANTSTLGTNGLSIEHLFFEHWYDPVLRSAQGFFEGFRTMTWIAILLQTVGGLLTAVALKYADNVIKGFALSLSIVFTFLLSVILFDFKVTAPAVLGGLTVVASTWLYEADPASVRYLLSKNGSSAGTPLIRRGHLIVLTVLGTTFVCAVFPIRHLSITNAVWDLVAADGHDFHLADAPKVAIADVRALNDRLLEGAQECGLKAADARRTLRLPFGFPRAGPSHYPYIVRDTSAFALDAILTSRFEDYANLVDIDGNEAPDFIYVPILTHLYASASKCNDSSAMQRAVNLTTSYVRELANSMNESSYPRIVLPISVRRSLIEDTLLSDENLQVFRDQVVLVSVESAPRTMQDAMRYSIDVPYPTALHLSSAKLPVRDHDRAKRSVGHYFLTTDRPYLLHYAGTKPSLDKAGLNDPFRGYALRQALSKQVRAYKSSGAAKHRILFDEFDLLRRPEPIESREHMEQSVFCLQPPGASPTRESFYIAAQVGCIPVIFRSKSYGRLFPTSPEVNDVLQYAVFVDENEIIQGKGLSIVERLAEIPDAEVRRKQKALQNIASKLQWSIPASQLFLDGELAEYRAGRGQETMTDAFALLLKELDAIKAGTWQGGRAVDTREGYKVKKYSS